MNGYIESLLIKYGHPRPHTPHISLHKHCELKYGSKEQLTPEEDTSPSLDNNETKCIQGIVGAFLYYARAVDNKLLVGLSAIGVQHEAATQRTNEAINQLLYYSATYLTDGIHYCSGDIIFCDQSDAGFHNDSKGHSRAGAHIFLSENDPMPKWNGSVLTLAQIFFHVLTFRKKTGGTIHYSPRNGIDVKQT